MRLLKKIKNIVTLCCLVAAFSFLGLSDNNGVSFHVNEVAAQENGIVPGGVKGSQSTAEYWRAVKQGIQGQVSIPDKKAGVLVQPFGDELRSFRNETQKPAGAYLLGGVIVLLILFYSIRGKITIDAGLSGRTVIRFNGIERFAHWLMASSFIYLALTGLNTLYGKYVLLPIIGQSAFAVITYYSKISHNFVGFAFMVGLAITIVLWIKDNIPSKIDVDWLLAGGGMFSKGVHPAARKFNAGQKILFWAVSLGGISISYTGLSLMMPFELAPFEGTFVFLNMIGFSLPTDLTPLQETQYSLLWHGIMTVVLTALIIAHIYIGSIGMEGAFDAMSTGDVDENWAREHHKLWLEELNSSDSDRE